MGKRKKEGKVRCPICPKLLSANTDMNRHLQTHDKAQFMIRCPWPRCDHATLQKSNMRFHMIRHRNLRPYECKVSGCEYKSADPATLIRHETRVHRIPPRRSAGNETPSAPRTTRRRQRVSPYTIPEEHASSSHLHIEDRAEEAYAGASTEYDTEVIAQGNNACLHSTSFPVHDSPSSGSGTFSPTDPPMDEHLHPLGSQQDVRYAAPQPIRPPAVFSDSFNNPLPPDSSAYNPPPLPFPLVPQGAQAATVSTLPSFSPRQEDMENSFGFPIPTGHRAVQDPSVPAPESFSPALYNMENSPILPMPMWHPSATDVTVLSPASLPSELYSVAHNLPHSMPQYDVQATSFPASGSRFPGSYEVTGNNAYFPAQTYTMPSYGVQSTPPTYAYDGYASTMVPFGGPQFGFSNAVPTSNMGMGGINMDGYPQPVLNNEQTSSAQGAANNAFVQQASQPYFARTFGDASTSGSDFGMQGFNM